MGLAEYKVVPKGNGWSVLHDGEPNNDCVSKEAAFESPSLQREQALATAQPIRVNPEGER